MRARLCALALILSFCESDPNGGDAGSSDAAPGADAGLLDAAPDADAGLLDAGPGEDAGPPVFPPPPPATPPSCTLRDTTELRPAGLLPAAVRGAAILRVGDWLYVLPGSTRDFAPTDETWLAPIQADGTIGEIVRGPPRPLLYTHGGTLVRAGDRLYGIGGITSTTRGGSRSEVVFSGALDADGVVREWTLEPSLLVGRENPAVVAVGETLLVIGGTNADKASTATTAEATYREGGALRPWTELWRGLTAWSAGGAAAARVGDFVYHASRRDVVRVPVTTLAPPMDLASLDSPFAAHGRILLGAGYDRISQTPVLDDGTLGPERELAAYPPVPTTRPGTPFSYDLPSITADDELLFMVHGVAAGTDDERFADQVWVAPLCAD